MMHLNNYKFPLSPKTKIIFLYSYSACDERLTFWLQRVQSLPCAFTSLALFVRRLLLGSHITIMKSHTHTMQQTGILKPKMYYVVKLI